MTSQKFSYRARVWLYVMIGRLLYWARDKDNWQVWMFHYGRPNVGKSTICQVFSELLYDSDDIGAFGNQVEKQFGLWGIYDKFGVVCSEVSKDFSIDRTELQQMISAERISIKGKNIKAASVDFRAPGMLAGNYIPSWEDPQGAMTRRLLIWHYENKVKVDNTLMSKIADEIPNIIVKCNRFYRAAVQYVGDTNLWGKLPPYFRKTQALMQIETSTIHGFLSSDVVVIRRDEAGEPDTALYVPMDELKKAYTMWKKDNDIKKATQWTVDNYQRVFADMGLPPPSKKRREYPRDGGLSKMQLFAFGIDLAENVEREENE